MIERPGWYQVVTPSTSSGGLDEIIYSQVDGLDAEHLRDDYGYLVAAQVGTAFRGRGIYRALVAARLQFLARRGISLAVTQAREETSAPLLARMGFETVFRSKCYLLESPPA